MSSMAAAQFPGEPLVLPARSLRLNSIWSLIGTAVYSLCQWGMLIVVAQLGSEVLVGQLALGYAIVLPTILFFNLQLRSVQASDVRREYAFEEYLSVRLVTTVFALATITTAAMISDYPWSTASVIMTVSVVKAFDAISDAIYGLFQQHERMGLIAGSMLIKGPVMVLLLTGGMWLTGNLIVAILVMAGGAALVFIGYDLPLAKRILGRNRSANKGFKPRWNWRGIGRIIRLALPLGAVITMTSLIYQVPQYVIEHCFGVEELGIFAPRLHLLIAGLMAINAVGEAASPRLARLYAAGDRQTYQLLLIKLAILASVLGLAFIAVAVVAGQPVLELLYGPSYAVQSVVFVILAFAGAVGFVAAVLIYGLIATRRFMMLLGPYALLTALSIGLSWWLTPRWGLQGAATALLLVQVATCVSLGWLLKRVLHGLPIDQTANNRPVAI